MAASDKALTEAVNFSYNCITNVNENKKSKQRQEYEHNIINDY